MKGYEIGGLRQRKNLLFVNKKKQKNFVNLELECSEPFYQKFFASFFQKRCFLYCLQPIDFRTARALTRR